VQTGFVPHPLPFGARLLYVFLAIPQGAFLGVALTQTRGVLYAHYAIARPAAAVIADQHDAGAVMWIAGGMMLFATFMITVATWAAREREPALGYTS
jgi:cytochrome c oxidase assembly factor CtaG